MNDNIFEALSSAPRRQILSYLSEDKMTAGEIAEQFDISKPSISKHLNILENAGLVSSERKGQFIYYTLMWENLATTLYDFLKELSPAHKKNT